MTFFPQVTIDKKWLQDRMDHLELGDSEVCRRMELYGYDMSRSVISNWRLGRAPISAQYLPLLCLALDYDINQTAAIVTEYAKKSMPFLEAFISYPSIPDLAAMEQTLKKQGIAIRKARLLAELEALENATEEEVA